MQTTVQASNEDQDYDSLMRRLRGVATSENLFTTDATGLYDAFLGALPVDRRQQYLCRTCKHFLERFGGLVTIDEAGVKTPAFWTDESWVKPPFFARALRKMFGIVERSNVTGVFRSDVPVLGNPQNTARVPSVTATGVTGVTATGVTWHHLHAIVKASSKGLVTADQQMAALVEDYGTLQRGLAEFSIDVVRQAHALLTTGGLYRSEKCIGVARWLLDIHEALAATKHRTAREHLVWRAVGGAPPGFCHVKSTVIGTLLEDVAAGKSFDAVKRSFDAKMAPLAYQRPQAAPRDGQLAAAEKVVATLASAGSLNRRFATLEDIADDAAWMLRDAVWGVRRAVWTSRDAAEKSIPEGVFGHLRNGSRTRVTQDVPVQNITWDKFWRTVLPTAESIECEVPRGAESFFAFVTAANADAPPILQWDREDSRNPVSWYLYGHGSLASHWNLAAGTWAAVQAITTQPSSWGRAEGGGGHQDVVDHHGNGVYLVLEGARDQRQCGNGLFPAILKSEYHGIRSSIEAYSRAAKLSAVDRHGRDAAPACGLALQKSNDRWAGVVRVTSRGGVRCTYKLDRWD